MGGTVADVVQCMIIMILSTSARSSLGVVFHPVPLTNSRHDVNENSQGQDNSDDLPEPPFIFARLDD